MDTVEDNFDDGDKSDDDIIGDWDEEVVEEVEEFADDNDSFEERSSSDSIPHRALSLLKDINILHKHTLNKDRGSDEDRPENELKNVRTWTNEERYTVADVFIFHHVDDHDAEYDLLSDRRA